MTPDERRARLIRRVMAVQDAERDLLAYTHLTMPDFSDLDDVRLSRYQAARHHKIIADALHDLEAGRKRRVIINCAPRHGKSELASKRFMAWCSGRNPEKSYILGTYNDTFAADFGRAVRDNMQMSQHKQVFPNFALKDGSASVQRLETTRGGILTFVGRGGSITGRGGHGIVIDDPIKDRTEADSPLIRQQLWDWFNQVIGTRLMTTDSFILIIQTRWHEDDLVGRLTDPTNSFYNPEEAKLWHVIDMPAIALEHDPLGRAEGEALWPEKFPVSFLEDHRRRDPRGFSALYQGRPSAEAGAFFQKEDLLTYRRDQLPKSLRYYCASDHAVSTKQGRDKTCLIPVGVDDSGVIWILPDVWWKQQASNVVVEAILDLIAKYKPIYWWAERGHISKSIGPFLRKRMQEEQTYCSIIEVTPVLDKQQRAQAIQGRTAMGRVMFPEDAPWWPDAMNQMLKFPFGANDDFVDALAYIGLGLANQVSADMLAKAKRAAQPGTFRWLLKQTKDAEAFTKSKENSAGF